MSLLRRRHPSGFIRPCLPSKTTKSPSGPLWVHEIKYDGYRLMVRRDGARVRCFTKNGYDWGPLPGHRRHCADAVQGQSRQPRLRCLRQCGSARIKVGQTGQ
jgi:ATP-dependent DNA ligase